MVNNGVRKEKKCVPVTVMCVVTRESRLVDPKINSFRNITLRLCLVSVIVRFGSSAPCKTQFWTSLRRDPAGRRL